MKYTRNKTRKVNVGKVTIGGADNIIVQSMTNTNTADVSATVKQIHVLEKAGCEIVRVSVPDETSAAALSKIKKKINIPLVADIHFDYKLALLAIANGADKVRINPGNMRKDKLKDILNMAKDRNTAIRIGVNSGSLKKLHGSSIKLSSEKRAGILVDAVSEYLNTFERESFYNTVVALKASDVGTTIKACEIFSNNFKYPAHIGITESGSLFQGSIKSTAGLAQIISGGLGDTMRISLSADPVWEVRAAYILLQSLGIRQKMPNIISCPTCARTTVDVIKLVAEIEKVLYSFDWSGDRACLKTIAVMGCVVNGPGEAKEADLGITGAGNKICLFKKGRIIATLKKEQFRSVF
ncbi:MAG: flavodoxin-dependent (E)-4-hydroxy-3-methylbut-2-enyl-diphosphate synthase [Elusimicrobiota bacterium]